MKAISQTAMLNGDLLDMLKQNIGEVVHRAVGEDDGAELQRRIDEINTIFKEMLKSVATSNVDEFDDEKVKELMEERDRLQRQLDKIEDASQKRRNAASRIDQICEKLDELQSNPMQFDDRLVRQLIECIVVESADRIKIVFVGGLTVEQEVRVDKKERKQRTRKSKG